MKIYVASSWRNAYQPGVVAMLKGTGHDIYDFRNPTEGDHGFHWSEIDSDWQNWTSEQYKKGLEHKLAMDGFLKDMAALRSAGATILVLPCGRSAHLELGYACGKNQYTAIFIPPRENVEPELMNKMVDEILTCEREVIEWAYRL